MAAFDIVGFGPHDHPVFVQVKNGGNRNSIEIAAAEMLEDAGDVEASLYLFCPEALKPLVIPDRVSLISIEDALGILDSEYGKGYLQTLQTARFP